MTYNFAMDYCEKEESFGIALAFCNYYFIECSGLTKATVVISPLDAGNILKDSLTWKSALNLEPLNLSGSSCAFDLSESTCSPQPCNANLFSYLQYYNCPVKIDQSVRGGRVVRLSLLRLIETLRHHGFIEDGQAVLQSFTKMFKKLCETSEESARKFRVLEINDAALLSGEKKLQNQLIAPCSSNPGVQASDNRSDVEFSDIEVNCSIELGEDFVDGNLAYAGDCVDVFMAIESNLGKALAAIYTTEFLLPVLSDFKGICGTLGDYYIRERLVIVCSTYESQIKKVCDKWIPEACVGVTIASESTGASSVLLNINRLRTVESGRHQRVLLCVPYPVKFLHWMLKTKRIERTVFVQELQNFTSSMKQLLLQCDSVTDSFIIVSPEDGDSVESAELKILNNGPDRNGEEYDMKEDEVDDGEERLDLICDSYKCGLYNKLTIDETTSAHASIVTGETIEGETYVKVFSHSDNNYTTTSWKLSAVFEELKNSHFISGGAVLNGKSKHPSTWQQISSLLMHVQSNHIDEFRKFRSALTPNESNDSNSDNVTRRLLHSNDVETDGAENFLHSSDVETDGAENFLHSSDVETDGAENFSNHRRIRDKVERTFSGNKKGGTLSFDSLAQVSRNGDHKLIDNGKNSSASLNNALPPDHDDLDNLEKSNSMPTSSNRKCNGTICRIDRSRTREVLNVSIEEEVVPELLQDGFELNDCSLLKQSSEINDRACESTDNQSPIVENLNLNRESQTNSPEDVCAVKVEVNPSSINTNSSKPDKKSNCASALPPTGSANVNDLKKVEIEKMLFKVIEDPKRHAYDFELLLREGLSRSADLTLFRNNSGMTLLHAIAMNDRTTFLLPLFRSGCWTKIRPLTIAYEKDKYAYSGKTAYELCEILGYQKTLKEIDTITAWEKSLNFIHVAARRGNLQEMQRLLEYSQDLHHDLDSMDCSTLYWAVIGGNIDIVRLLLEKGVDHNRVNSRNETLLHACCMTGRANLVPLLINELNMDVLVQDSVKKTPLKRVAENGDKKTLERLIECGVSKDLIGAVLPIAGHYGRLDFIRFAVENYKANPQTKDDVSKSAFMRAADQGNIEVLRYLIAKRIDLAEEDSRGRNALHMAADGSDTETVSCLIYAIKSKPGLLSQMINARDKYVGSELCMMIRGRERNFDEQPGRESWHYVEVLRSLYDIFNSRSRGGTLDIALFGTVLMSGWGAAPDDAAVAEVEKRFETRRVTASSAESDVTPLHIAAFRRKTDIMRVLLENGASVSIRDKFGMTPLHISAMNGNMPGVQLLIKHGANANLLDSMIKTPADVAEENEHMDVASYLKSLVYYPIAENFRKVLSDVQQSLSVDEMNKLQGQGVDMRIHLINTLRNLTLNINETLCQLDSGPVQEESTATSPSVKH